MSEEDGIHESLEETETKNHGDDENDLASRSVYIEFRHHNLSAEISYHDLTTIMGKFGKIKRIIFDKEWNRFAIVQFASTVQAKKVLELKEHEFGQTTLIFKKAKLKSNGNIIAPVIQLDEIRNILAYSENGTLFEQMSDLKNVLGISVSNKLHREKITKFLEKHLEHYFEAKIVVKLFGSSMTGLGTKFADIDLNLEIINPGNHLTVNLRNVADIPLVELAKNGIIYEEFQLLSNLEKQNLIYRILRDVEKRIGTISNVKSIPGNKIPVVTFGYDQELICELSVENELSEIKANFIVNILQDKNQVLIKSLFILRLWAQLHGVFGTDPSTKLTAFKSYAFSLLFVAYLQDCGILGSVLVDGRKLVNDWIVDYESKESEIPTDNKTIGNLISGFFTFCCQKLKENHVLSIKLGKIMDIDQFKEISEQFDERILTNFVFNVVNVQDPLELSHNVTGQVGRQFLSLLRRKCMISLSNRKKNQNSLLSIFDLTEKETSIGLEERKEGQFGFKLIFEKYLDGQKVIETMKTIIEDVLKMKNDETESNGIKKLKLENVDEFYHFSEHYWTNSKIWIGRRGILREIKTKYPNEPLWRIEKMVTTKIQQNHEENEPVLFFQLEAEYLPETGAINVRITESDNKQATSEFCHFLEQFLGKNNFATIQSLMEWQIDVKNSGNSEIVEMDIDG